MQVDVWVYDTTQAGSWITPKPRIGKACRNEVGHMELSFMWVVIPLGA